MPIVRSNGRQSSYLGKIAAYRDILARRVHKTVLGIPNLIVLTITTSESRVVDIVRSIEGGAGDSAPFLFKTAIAAILRQPAPQLLSEPWLRAGLPALRIDEAG